MKTTTATNGAEEIRAQLPRLAAATGAPPPGDGRSLPSIARNQPLAGLALAVAQALRPAPLFRRGEMLVTVDATTGEVQPMTATRWRSWHQRFFHFHEGDGDKRRTVNAPQDLALCVLASDEFRAHVRELRGVNLLRLPVWRGDAAARALDLLPEGYDASTQTFTVPLLDYPLDWPLEDAHAWLDANFGGFPFAETGDLFTRRSFAAFVGGMLGVFTVNLLPHGAVRPLVLVIGNQPGVGKSTLVRAILTPTHGETEEDSKPKSDEELRKVLDAAALAGAAYVFLDDVHNLASNDLNHFISSPTHTPRVMGQGTRVKCANSWQVFATGNHLKLAEDLPRRSLVVFLATGEKASEREIADPMTNTILFSAAYRAHACAALWAMLRHWRDCGMPTCREARLSSFEAYAALVGSVCVAARLTNPFAPIVDWPMGGDEAGRTLETALCRMAATLDPGDELTPAEILANLSESNALDVVLPFDCKDERKALGHKLRKLRGRVFTDAKGRRFEFGRREGAAGAFYAVHFLAPASE